MLGAVVFARAFAFIKRFTQASAIRPVTPLNSGV